MKSPRGEARAEWVQAHVTEATRLATLLTADPVRAPRIAEDALAAALETAPSRRSTRLSDALLAQLVRRARGVTADEHESEHLTALGALPRRQRAAVVLRHYADLSDERASVFLGCSPKAVADLVAKGVAALPDDASPEVREWLDAAPSPPPATAARAVLRRSRRRRTTKAAGALVAAAALGLTAARVPDLVRPPAPPDPAIRLAEIRRAIERQKAALPFDPDDAGAGTTRLFTVSDGVVGGTVWSVRGYSDAGGNACLQLIVGNDFGSRRCMTATTTPLHAIVETDPKHRVTFISGMVAAEVDSLQFVGPGVPWMDVTIGHEDPEAEDEPGFFGIALADYLLPLESKEAGRKLGYRLRHGKLTARDAQGRPVADVELVLAKR